MSQVTENYCRRTTLLLRLLEGDLAGEVSEAGRDEIRRCLHVAEPEIAVQPHVVLDAD